MPNAILNVSTTLIAQALQAHWPWPDGTVIETLPDPLELEVVEFTVSSKTIPTGIKEVSPSWIVENGFLRFDRW